VGSAEAAVENAEIVILTARSPEYIVAARSLRGDQILLDFANVPELSHISNYNGVNW
jgi:predicted dinucleotide-binding enzyme